MLWFYSCILLWFYLVHHRALFQKIGYQQFSITNQMYLENDNWFWKYASAKKIIWDRRKLLWLLTSGLGGTTSTEQFVCWKSLLLASWSSGNAFVSGAGGLSFKSWAGQIEHSVATGSPPSDISAKKNPAARAQWRRDGPHQLVTRFGVMQRVH